MSAKTDNHFSILEGARRVWAVGAIHGESERLKMLHEGLTLRFREGDRLVYLGNFLGWGADIVGTQNELLRQRTALLARPAMETKHIAFLRGAQEEMWRKMLQLQFAPAPEEVLEWMLAQGVEPTLAAYGQSAHAGRAACREGALSIAKWTNLVRSAVHSQPGHVQLMSALRRAAYTSNGELLFVAAGIDPARPLGEQGDTFWWGSGFFTDIDPPYEGYQRIVRGSARTTSGADTESYSATLDGGCGRGGTLIAACFTPDGATDDLIEA